MRPRTVTEWVNDAHETAKKNGFWEGYYHNGIRFVRLTPDQTLSKIALIMSELGEAVEEIRNAKPNVYFGTNGKPEGLGAELSDVVLRIFDLCGALDIDLETC